MQTPSISRRSAAATLAAAPILGGSLLSAAAAHAKPRANAPIRMGIIGCGKRTDGWLNRFLATPDIRIVAVCDVDTTRRESMQKKVNNDQKSNDVDAYNDYHKILDRKDINAVAIMTPDHWHAHQIIDACNAGKHIYSEKPLTHTIYESKMVIEAVKKSGVVFQTGSQQRTGIDYKRVFVRAVEYIQNGMAGECSLAYGNVGRAARPCNLPEEAMEPGLDWDRWLGPAPMRPYNSVLSPRGMHDHFPAWRHYREYAGGGLADFGAHHFDIIQWAWSKDHTSPTKVIPSENRRSGVGAKLVYADGKTIVHGRPNEESIKRHSGATWVTDKGILQADRRFIDSTIPGLLDQKPPSDGVNIHRYKSHVHMFTECVLEGKTPTAHVEAGARTATICHLFALAYYLNRELTFDPDTWTFVNDNEANQWLDYDRRPGHELPSIG